ncbi:MAG: ABC transporter substrate-binding protein [Oscillospiraceae bacterium]|nr:ABC transporter substrate-binding protein [Oscillospiraceae bacterium]
MKCTKLLTILLIALLAVGLMVGCDTLEPEPTPELPALSSASQHMPISVNVGILRGPSGMGMAPLMAWAEDGQTRDDYHFTVGGAPEEMVAGIISGELDIAAVGVNQAAMLYERTGGDVRIISALTQSLLFVLDSTGEINTIADLQGQTIHITGQGAIPQFAFEHILRSNGLEPGVDVEIVFNAEHAELAALMVAGEVGIGLLPQPFVTSVLNQSDDVTIALDLAEEWNAVSPDSVFVQGSVVVRTEFLEANPIPVERFLQDHAESLAFVMEHVDEAAELMEQFDIVPAGVARQVIPISNFVYIIGAEMQRVVDAFLTILYDANPDTVGGRLPSAEFYFLG